MLPGCEVILLSVPEIKIDPSSCGAVLINAEGGTQVSVLVRQIAALLYMLTWLGVRGGGAFEAMEDEHIIIAVAHFLIF